MEKVTIDNYFRYFQEQRTNLNKSNLSDKEKIKAWIAIYNVAKCNNKTVALFDVFVNKGWISPNGLIYEDKPVNYNEATDPVGLMDSFMKKGVAVWTTQDDTEINVSDMEDDHIVNTYNYLKRKDQKSELTNTWIEIFKIEANERGLELELEEEAKTMAPSIGLGIKTHEALANGIMDEDYDDFELPW